jgi:hypothetical protein
MDTLKLYEDLAHTLDPQAARAVASAIGAVYEELHQALTREDLAGLRDAVAELAQAQARTEQRLEALAEAQARTEQRLEVLANAQARTEQRLEQLAEAQQRVEIRVSALERAVTRLAEAQARTEREVATLARGLKETREMVAGLSDTVGYGLEDRAMATLPGLLKREYGIEVEGRLVRRFVEYPEGGGEEVNILGAGRKDSAPISIVGEAKSRPGKKDVDQFLKRVERLDRHGLLAGERFLLLVAYSVNPEVERYAKGKGLTLVPSYLLAA